MRTDHRHHGALRAPIHVRASGSQPRQGTDTGSDLAANWTREVS